MIKALKGTNNEKNRRIALNRLENYFNKSIENFNLINL